MNNNPLCIYHGNCQDGFAAAWAVRSYFTADVEFFPATHGKPGPDVDYCRGRRVIMVDFCYPLETMCRIYAESEWFTVLDHHATALPILQELAKVAAGDPCFFYNFDLNRSGAGIAWDYFNAPASMPRLLRHIQDRDLWRFELDDTKAVSAALFAEPYDFNRWDKLVRYGESNGGGWVDFIAGGEAIMRKQAKDIAELLPVLTQIWTIAGEPVPMANLPYTYSSEAGHALLQAHPHAGFAGTYYDAPHGRVVSFRSEDGRADVGAVAKRLGGGGHRNASGATMPIGWHGDEVVPNDDADFVGWPAVGSLWQHRNGIRYTVRAIANTEGGKPNYRPTVVYENVVNHKIYSRLARDWHRSMTLVAGGAAGPADAAERGGS